MRKLLEGITSIIPTLLLITYALGYVNLKVFYMEFGIDIEYYITFSDILFYTVNVLIVLFIIIVFYSYLLVFISVALTTILGNLYFGNYFKLKGKEVKVNNRFLQIKSLILIPLGVMGINLIILIPLSFITDETLYVFTFLFLTSFTYIYLLLPTKSQSQERLKNGLLRDRDYYYITIFLVLLTLNIFQGIKRYNEVVNDKYYFRKPKKIEFVFNSKYYSVDKEIKYIGETTEYLFLYNSTTEKSLIFNKTTLSNYKVTSPKNISQKNVKYYIDFVRDIYDKFNE